MRRGMTDRGKRALITLIGVMALFLVPAECSAVTGAHSLYASPDALAALTAPERAESLFASHDHTRHEPASQTVAPSLPASAGATLDGPASDPWPLLPLGCDWAPGGDGGQLEPPRLLSFTGMTAAPAVPAVLDSGSLLLALPAVTRAWQALRLPDGRLLSGPEPPPP